MRLSKIGRKKLFVDQSRRWNLDEPAAGAASKMKTKIRLILFGYMWYDEHVESLLNLTGSCSSNGNNSKKTTFLENLVDTFIKLKDKINFTTHKKETGQFYILL